MLLVLSLLPAVLLAFTISTDVKVGDDICTNVDVARHKVFSERLLNETKTTALAPEDTLEGKALIKRYLALNQLRFSPEEREALFQMHMQRMGATVPQFEQYLQESGLSKEAFIEEMAYRQEVLRWMVQTYSWKEVVTKSELASLKKQMAQQLSLAPQNLITFEVLKLKSKSDFPEDMGEEFWKSHAKTRMLYEDVSLTSVPEPYEAFLSAHKAGDISQPFEAFGSWHVLRILSKPVVTLPPDEMLKNSLIEQKCMKHLSVWAKEQLPWMYRDN